MEIEAGKLYDVQEVAAALSVPASSVRWWAQRDIVHGVKIGRAWRIKGEEILRIREEGTRKPKAKQEPDSADAGEGATA